MSNLPEWLREDSPCPHGEAIDFSDTCSKCTEQAFKALRIAWEALERQSFAFDKATPDEFISIAKDAMDRIHALGNEGVGE